MFDAIMLHEETREYAYPLSRDRLLLKLRCAGSGGVFFVNWCNRFHDSGFNRVKMECRGRDGSFAWYACEIAPGESVKYLRYYFELGRGSERAYFGVNGCCEKPPEKCFEYLYANDGDVFQTPVWARGAVAYQVFPERFRNGDRSNDPPQAGNWDGRPTRENFFGGDLRGVIDRLDHIAGLGADLLYLTPVFKAPSNHKYDTEDYYAVDPSFGSKRDLQELVAQCHRRGIRVVLDGVFNHCGYTFNPFQDVLRKGRKSKYADWFYIEDFPVRDDPPNYECVGYYKTMPKLRLKNRAARDYFLNVGIWWIQKADIDGWRLDVADEVDSTFWQEFRRAVKEAKEDALLIGETWKDGRDLLRGDEMDTVMNYLFREAVVGYFAQLRFDCREFDRRVQRILCRYPDAAIPVLYNLLGSHDTPRFSTLCGGDIRRMRLAVAFQMTFPGIPAIYYGDEFAMRGENDPDCRGAMNWEGGDRDLYAFYRLMASLRRANPPLKFGDFRSIICEGCVYGYARRHEGQTVYVLLNNGDEQTLHVPLFGRDKPVNLLSGEQYVPADIDGSDSFFNGDIYDYAAKFEMALPARHFEIIKQGGSKE
jgi:cyclomaltodextrinase